jgi:type I restriction enzyme S subunit
MELKAGYKQTDIGIVPTDWRVLPIGALGKFKNGINKDSASFGHGAPFVNLMDVFGVSRIDSSEAFGLVATNSLEQKTYDLQTGDVIFIRSSVKPSGVGLTAVVERDLSQTVYSGFLIRFRDGGNLDIRFKRHCFYEEGFRTRLMNASSVSANTNINQDNLKRLEIAIPPTKAEQEAIAEALSDADALIESLDQLITKKRHLKQGAMQELLTGKRRLPGFSGEWEVKRLGDVLRFQVGCPFSSEFFNQKGDGIRLIKNRDLKADDQIFYFNGKFDDTYLVKDGDVLIGMDGDFLPCLWSKGGALLNQRVGRVVASPKLSASFAHFMLLEPLKAIENATSATTVKHLSHSDVEGIECPLPSNEQQTAIATILSDMDTELAELESRLAKARHIKQGMMQELLTGRIRLI